ncbi:MAG TPA: DUF1736 domain-containing protein [Longimicrobiales bacterium]|nr:DUF1736 domain-containing protein [Longimicrobiales bacterium]
MEGSNAPPRGGPWLRLRDGRWQIAVAAVAVVLYLPSVGFGWVYDDQMEVVRNTVIRSFANVPAMFSSTVWAGSGMETYLYRPLALVSYAANYAVSGLSPWSYHLVNVLLHAGVAALVVRVGLLWGLSAGAAGMAGVLFAVHPVHVEAVAAVFARKDLLATLFVLATLLSHRRGLSRGGVNAALPILWFTLAMLSKEIGVVALPLVLLQDLRLERDRRTFFDRRRVMVLYFGYMTSLVAYLLIRVAVVGGFGIGETYWLDNPLVAASVPVRLVTAAVVLAKGVGLLVLPLNLSPDYSYDAIPPVTSVTDPRLVGVLAVAALLAWGLAHHRWRRGAAWAVGAYLVAIFPVANFAVVTGTIFGDRLLYLPSVAFCLSVGWAAGATIGRSPEAGPAIRTAAAVALLLLGAQTVRYSLAWTDDIALFSWATATQPNSTKAHHKLGEELLRAGRIGEALPSLERALVIAPANVHARETLATALQLAAADTSEGPDLLRGFIASAGSRHPREVAWAREMLRLLGEEP